jgi:hypothetical protein
LASAARSAKLDFGKPAWASGTVSIEISIPYDFRKIARSFAVDAEFAIYLINSTGVQIKPGEEQLDYYDFNQADIFCPNFDNKNNG